MTNKKTHACSLRPESIETLNRPDVVQMPQMVLAEGGILSNYLI